MTPKRPDPIAHLTGNLSKKPYPSGVSLPGQGGKFDTCGGVQIWRGNTFVRHVTKGSDSFAALVELQEAVKRSEFARFYTFLPAPSFHMTVFQGYSPRSDIGKTLPADLASNLGADCASTDISKRVAGLSLPHARARPSGLFCLHSVTMEGASPEDERALRQARQRLRDATGLNPPDFDSYVFHITMAYLTQWLSPTTAAEVVAFSAELGQAFCATNPDIALDPCAFCTFESMHHFEPLLVLPWDS
ncbi:DUF1868 domain-containing protein [Roseibium sp.]|uniref:DUF1868 domain-containing protein n=1 Tax=Roseibium sp. TaxID=1936156 RepID=UPI003B5048EA